ncbi:hypothetical protein [Streptomyces sp. NPDC004680]|uniref:hypothetical protein n=1 Tax=Streptomyces sp. NPDC004680 TaxID=3154287 RepID=UPI0033B30556
MAAVLGLARSQRISRSDPIGTYFYKVQGAGCRFISGNDAGMDVDFTADGREIFCAVMGKVCRSLLASRITTCDPQ